MELKKITELFIVLVSSDNIEIPAKGKLKTTQNHGVYIIYSSSHVVFHVGRTTRGALGLEQRLNNHVSGSSSFRDNYLKRKGISLRNGYYVKLVEVPDARIRALLEAYTCGNLCPLYIGTGEPKETHL